jgi:hypothetical protein
MGEWYMPRPGRFTPESDLVNIVEEAVVKGCGKSCPQRDLIPRPSSCTYDHVTIYCISLNRHLLASIRLLTQLL